MAHLGRDGRSADGPSGATHGAHSLLALAIGVRNGCDTAHPSVGVPDRPARLGSPTGSFGSSRCR